MMNPQTLRAVGQAHQQVHVTLAASMSPLTLFQMAGMGMNPMQGFGANPMAATGALPPQVAALAPTRQNLEQQVISSQIALFSLISSFSSVAVFFPAAAAGGDGLRQSRAKPAGSSTHRRQRRGCSRPHSVWQLQLIHCCLLLM
jgi:hypothetical protein